MGEPVKDAALVAGGPLPAGWSWETMPVSVLQTFLDLGDERAAAEVRRRVAARRG